MTDNNQAILNMPTVQKLLAKMGECESFNSQFTVTNESEGKVLDVSVVYTASAFVLAIKDSATFVYDRPTYLKNQEELDKEYLDFDRYALCNAFNGLWMVMNSIDPTKPESVNEEEKKEETND